MMNMLSQATLISLFALAIGSHYLDQVESIRYGVSEDELKIHKDGIALKELGNNKLEEKKYEEALYWYNRALEEVKGDDNQVNRELESVLYYNIAIVHATAKKENYTQLSIEACSQAIKLCETYKLNNFIKPYALRAEIYASIGAYDNAMADYSQMDDLASPDLNNHELCLNIKKRIQELAYENALSERLKNHYDILNIDMRTATMQDIKRAHRKLAMIYHPDKHFNANKHIKELNGQKFKRLQQAYIVLSDPVKKAEYDYYLMNRIRIF